MKKREKLTAKNIAELYLLAKRHYQMLGNHSFLKVSKDLNLPIGAVHYGFKVLDDYLTNPNSGSPTKKFKKAAIVVRRVMRSKQEEFRVEAAKVYVVKSQHSNKLTTGALSELKKAKDVFEKAIEAYIITTVIERCKETIQENIKLKGIVNEQQAELNKYKKGEYTGFIGPLMNRFGRR